MKRLLLCLLVLCLLPVWGCGERRETSQSFYLMGTVITVTLYTDEDTARPHLEACRRLLEELDALWSRTREESEVSSFYASPEGLSKPDPRTVTMLQTALAVSKATDGAFDPTVAPLVSLWERAEAEGRLPTADQMQETLAAVDYKRLTVTPDAISKSDPSLTLDLGGIGKGAAITHLLAYLQASGLPGGVVSFGSNVAVFGAKPDGASFRIALRDPKSDTGGTLGVLSMTPGTVLSVSGDYERYVTVEGKRYHHLLDPATGYPAESGLSSVAVLAADGALADALSTALFVLGEEQAQALYRSGTFSFEAIFVASDGALSHTPGLSGWTENGMS